MKCAIVPDSLGFHSKVVRINQFATLLGLRVILKVPVNLI